MKLPIEAHGVCTQDEQGVLAVRYSKFNPSNEKTNSFQIDSSSNQIVVHLVEDEAIQDVPTAWLKLYLLSLRHFKPNELNFDNIFSVLPNLAWTNNGPMRVDNLSDLNLNEDLKIFALDKFPPMTDYVIPKGVRIADATRVRLGAYLGEGTTIMHEGFVNYNAGTDGPNMI